jgi:outer membrane protein OmpA-like peptidoglycan-associated protein
MQRKNRLYSLLLILSAGLLTLAPAAHSQEVNSDDLMNAMRQTLGQPAPAPEAAAPTVVEPKPEPRIVPITKPATETAKKKEPEKKPEAKEAKEEAILPPPKPLPTAESSPVKAAPATASAPTAPAPVATTPSGAPLLSDMQEPPNVLVGGAAATSEEGKKLTAPGGGNFSQPRPLFSKKGGKKRAGVSQRVKPDTTVAVDTMSKASAPPAPTPVAPAPAAAPAAKETKEAATVPPPVPKAEKAEPKLEASKKAPSTSSGGALTVPPPSETQGTVTYSQKVGEAPPVLTAREPEAQEEAVAEPAPAASPPPAPPAAEEKEEKAPEPVSQVEEPKAEQPKSISGIISNALRASCGAANGVGTATQPANDLCSEGEPSEVKGKGPWTWNCKGGDKGEKVVSCSAPMMVSGECGMANGSQLASAPPAKQLCTSGKSSSVTGKGPWHWNCFGSNGGGVAQCVAYTLVKGACGPANKVAIGNKPSSGLCASGKQTEISGEGPWNWSCIGSGEGTEAKCSAPLARNGECGVSHGVGSAEKPSSNLCAYGRASPVTGKGPWSWSCIGESGGNPVSCSATVMTNATCGSSHGTGMSAAPSNGLCASGTPSEVSGNGPWNWTCLGSNGGAKANCMSPVLLAGTCGPSHGEEADEPPAQGLCASGTPSNVAGTGPWNWTCQGSHGGASASCMAPKLVASACGPAHGVGAPAPPTSGLCSTGAPTSVIGSGPWMWSCQDTKAAHPVNCMAPIMVNAACGTATSVSHASTPDTDLCSGGNSSLVAGNGPWSWTCQGSGGGMSVTCRAEASEHAAERTTVAATPVPESGAEEEAPAAAKTSAADGDCVPSVKRWTITCQQGGYPTTYAGVIVGETQILCPTGVERGVWLSNSCAPSSTTPVSPSPGVLKTTAPPELDELLPEMEPLSSKSLKPPAKGKKGKATTEQPSMASTPALMPPRLNTPRFQGTKMPESSVAFAPASEKLDTNAAGQIDNIVGMLQGQNQKIITLNAYAPMPKSNDEQEARRIALARALAVRSYMVSRGVATNRIDIRAVGPAGDNLGDDRVDIKVD